MSVLLCCKLILQSCKTLCTQKFLDTSQIPFNNPSWDTMSWRPWSLLAFSENLDSLGNKSMYSWWVLSDVVDVMNIHHGCIYHQTSLDGCTGGQPWTKEKTQCQVAIQTTPWSLVEFHKDSQTLEGKSSLHFHHRGPCSVQTQEDCMRNFLRKASLAAYLHGNQTF